MFNPFASFQDKTAVSVDVVKKAQDTKEGIIVDVRRPEEYTDGHIGGSIFIPLQEFEQSLHKISDKTKTYYVYCRTGNRSAYAVSLLRQRGYTDAHNMLGGINEWISKNYPVQK